MSRTSAGSGRPSSSESPDTALLDASNDRPLTTGRRSDILPLGDGHVVKLLKRRFRREAAENERHYTIQAREQGIPVPLVGEVVEIGGRSGIVFERICGHTLKDLILARPWMIGRYAGMLARLHAAIHSRRGGDLPRQREQLEERILAVPSLSRGAKKASTRALAQLKDGDALCHGDLHSANVVVSERGPFVIDWSGATRGNSVADVATTLMVTQQSHHHVTGVLMKLLVRLLSSLGSFLYLRQYRKLRPVSSRELRAWRPVVAAARLGIRPEARTLKKIAKLRS